MEDDLYDLFTAGSQSSSLESLDDSFLSSQVALTQKEELYAILNPYLDFSDEDILEDIDLLL